MWLVAFIWHQDQLGVFFLSQFLSLSEPAEFSMSILLLFALEIAFLCKMWRMLSFRELCWWQRKVVLVLILLKPTMPNRQPLRKGSPNRIH